MVPLKDLNLELNTSVEKVKFNDDITITVQKYLPIDKKTELIQFIIGSSLDGVTGCFSPLRVEVYFTLGICKWYTDLECDLTNPGYTYDLLESNDVFSLVMNAIPNDELEFLKDLVKDTVKDVSRYNCSAAGIIHYMSGDANNLSEQLEDIIQKVNTEEGKKLLSTIRDSVG